MATRRRMGMIGAAVVSLLMSACSASPESLERAAEESPGVIRAQVGEERGDDFIPFARFPKYVRVVMEEDATAPQVMAVFDAYDGDVDAGDVVYVKVVLEGPKRVTLVSGEGVQATRSMVEDLVRAQGDDDIVEYHRQFDQVLPGVELSLVPLEFDEVVAVADRYGNAEGVDSVQVVSGRFTLIRDTVNEDPGLTNARERFVLRVDRRFRLTGAVTSGRGPLELLVVPAELDALRRHVDHSRAARKLGLVRVSPRANET